MVREMAEGEPPYMEFPTARALFLILTKGVPELKEKTKWSPEMKAFLDASLTKDLGGRPTSEALLRHPFLKKACPVAEFKVGCAAARPLARSPPQALIHRLKAKK